MVVKRCTKPYSVFRNGRPQVVTPGMLLDENDPRYRQDAGRFEDITAYVDRTSGHRVEAATADPGDKRDMTPAPDPAPAPIVSDPDVPASDPGGQPPTAPVDEPAPDPSPAPRRGPGRPRKPAPKEGGAS